jgi:hypothetical protein
VTKKRMTKRGVSKRNVSKIAATKKGMRKKGITMDLFRFSRSAIDELNRDPGMHRQTRKEFAVLMAGLGVVLLMLYAIIVW